MQPMDYSMDIAGTADVLAGFDAGQRTKANQQEMRMNKAREARAAELHPIAMEGAQLQNQAQQQAMEAQRAQIARQEAFQTAMGRLAQLGTKATAEDFAMVTMEFPQLSRGLMDTFETLDDSRKRGTVQVLAQAAVALKNGNTDRAIKLANDYATAAEQAGDAQGAATARGMAQIMEVSPDAALASLGVAIHGLDSDTAEFVFGGGDTTVREVRDFDNGTSVTYFSDGRQVVRDAAGNEYTGDEATQLIAAANEFETGTQRARSAGREEGKLTSQAQGIAEVEGAKVAGREAVQLGLDAFEKIGAIRGNIGRLDRVVELIDEGANTGQIASRLPAWNEATKELRQLEGALGLDVVGSVTFGALSEGELRLAMQVALPTQLDEASLRQWALEKKAAQEKLIAYLDKQARFLSRPGNTLADWFDKMEKEGAAPAPADPSPPQRTVAPSYLNLLGSDR
jgi:hypothetical protein